MYIKPTSKPESGYSYTPNKNIEGYTPAAPRFTPSKDTTRDTAQVLLSSVPPCGHLWRILVRTGTNFTCELT